MTVVLGMVAIASYLLGFFAFLTSASGPATDIQLILAGVYFTNGTAAMAGIGIINSVNRLGPKEPEEEAKS